ncbi:MAG: hypothetical protein RLZ48_420, partial [Actinomycetota bacterium]
VYGVVTVTGVDADGVLPDDDGAFEVVVTACGAVVGTTVVVGATVVVGTTVVVVVLAPGAPATERATVVVVVVALTVPVGRVDTTAGVDADGVVPDEDGAFEVVVTA